MRIRRWTLLLILWPVCLPVSAAPRNHGVGFGLAAGTVDSDPFVEEFHFTGFVAFGKIGFTENWGARISFREMGDDEDFLLLDLEYTQVGIHAVYMWRAGKIVRPHVKFGVTATDFEDELFGVSDDDVNLAAGGGLEVGPPEVAFFGDLDYTESTFFGTDLEFANLTIGIIFKF